jgi:hypothetical protein
LSTDPFLPPYWRPDPALKTLIPPTHDWRTFARIPRARRYAACICGSGVYDLQERRFLSPYVTDGRKRFRLVASEPAKGKLDAVRTPYYSSIILSITDRQRPSRKMQAHHKDHDRTHDHWSNLSWVTAKSNTRMAVQHKSRSGDDNPNMRMSSNALAEFIASYDDEMRTYGRVNLKPYAECYGVTVDQLRRLANEKSRADEVRTLRTLQRHHRKELARHLEENPFLM